MTRTPMQAEDGTLNLLMDCQDHDWPDIIPVLQCYTRNITFIGSVGDGQRVELLHNFVSLGFATILSKVAAVSETPGIDARLICDIRQDGGGRGAILDHLRPMFGQQDASHFQFTVANSRKNLGYYAAMSKGYLNACSRRILC